MTGDQSIEYRMDPVNFLTLNVLFREQTKKLRDRVQNVYNIF